MNSLRALKTTLLALLALALLPAAAMAAPKFDREIPVPGIETPDKIVEGQDGNMWVTVSGGRAGDNGADDVARITPGGDVKEFKLEAGGKEIVGASGIARDAEGHLWVTGEGKVAKFKPVLGEVTDTAIEDLTQVMAAGNGAASIVLGPDGRMWVATVGNVIAFKPTETQIDTDGHRELIQIGGLMPHDIDVAGSRIVIADQGSKIVTFTTGAAVTQQDFTTKGQSQGVAGLKDGSIAYSIPVAEATVPETPPHVGLISPPNVLPIIPTPAPGGDPFGVTVGSDGAYWFVMSAFNELARLAPGGNQLTFVTGMQNASLARQIAAGPNNTLWATVTKADSEGVARFTGIEPGKGENHEEPKSEPQTTIAKKPPATVRTRAPRATVSFTFSSSPAGASFQCRLVRVGAKAPGFAACGSHKVYRLRPGRYRFEARAVLGGVVEKTPALRSFRVVRSRHR